MSTDNELILQTANAVNVHWRSEESATDEASSLLGVLDFIKNHQEVDVVALIQCTSPFIRLNYLKDALNFMKNGEECVFSVSR